jgi:hypothetical protein
METYRVNESFFTFKKIIGKKQNNSYIYKKQYLKDRKENNICL